MRRTAGGSKQKQEEMVSTACGVERSMKMPRQASKRDLNLAEKLGIGGILRLQRRQRFQISDQRLRCGLRCDRLALGLVLSDRKQQSTRSE